MFRHKFAGKTYQMAVLIKYLNVQKDKDSGLWWALVNKTTDIVVPLDQLSSPLVVAIEGEQLWFLNTRVVI